MGNIENRQVPTTFSQHFVDVGLSNPLWNSMEVEGQGRRKKGKVCPPKTFPICQRLDGGEDGCLFCLGHASSFIRLRTSILSSVSFKHPPRLSVVDMGETVRIPKMESRAARFALPIHVHRTAVKSASTKFGGTEFWRKDERTGWRHEAWPDQCLSSETADLVTRCRRFVSPPLLTATTAQ
ncbi:hypothetical protein BDP67DRAFT_571615 [Colletotrichum lupini]|nr:hypothetical protein BDP67DRAFT_571615 [Colletotrichum lupini]